MAFIEISRLPETSNIDNNSVFPVVYQAETRKVDFNTVKSLMKFFQSASYNKTTGVFTFGLSDDTYAALNSGLNKSIKDLDLNGSTLTITYQDDTTDTLQLPAQDLTDYVKNTDYATANKGGVIKGNVNGFIIGSTGNPSANTYTYQQYISTAANYHFIGKGTLENVLNARIGDIETLLYNINRGSGV